MFDVGCWMFGARPSRVPLLFHLDILVAVTRAAGAEPSVDEGIEFTVEHTLGITGGHPGAQILHHLVGLQHIRANLRTPADFALLAVELLHLAALLVLSL